MKWIDRMRAKVRERRTDMEKAAKKRRIDERAMDLIRQGWPPSSAVDVARNEERHARRAGVPAATATKC